MRDKENLSGFKRKSMRDTSLPSISHSIYLLYINYIHKKV